MTQLNGTAAKLEKLVLEHGTYEFEGFYWMPCNIESVAENLGTHKNTIRKIIKKPPFHYLTRVTKELGRHILLKLGTEPCETDRVFVLRAIWVKGLVYFNAELASRTRMKVMHLKSMNAPKEMYERLLHRIVKAEERAEDHKKLQAGKKISLAVRPSEMGLLRGVAQRLGDNSVGVLDCLVSFEGWHTFVSHLKIEERISRHYHWPTLKEIRDHPDIALQVYIDTMQADAKIDPTQSAKLLAKVAALAPKVAYAAFPAH